MKADRSGTICFQLSNHAKSYLGGRHDACVAEYNQAIRDGVSPPLDGHNLDVVVRTAVHLHLVEMLVRRRKAFPELIIEDMDVKRAFEIVRHSSNIKAIFKKAIDDKTVDQHKSKGEIHILWPQRAIWFERILCHADYCFTEKGKKFTRNDRVRGVISFQGKVFKARHLQRTGLPAVTCKNITTGNNM